MPRKKWFISHPSSAQYSTPIFFKAIDKFAAENNIDIVLPHNIGEGIDNTKKDIEAADIVLTEVSIASTGSGIELGWAYDAQKTIIAFYQGVSKISPAIKLVTKNIHPYLTEEHILEVLRNLL